MDTRIPAAVLVAASLFAASPLRAENYQPCMSGKFCPGPAAEYVSYMLSQRNRECRASVNRKFDAMPKSDPRITSMADIFGKETANTKERKAALDKCDADYDGYRGKAAQWIGQMAWEYVLKRIEEDTTP